MACFTHLSFHLVNTPDWELPQSGAFDASDVGCALSAENAAWLGGCDDGTRSVACANAWCVSRDHVHTKQPSCIGEDYFSQQYGSSTCSPGTISSAGSLTTHGEPTSLRTLAPLDGRREVGFPGVPPKVKNPVSRYQCDITFPLNIHGNN